MLSRSVVSLVWLFVTLWNVAHQVPLSLGFSRREYQSGLPFAPPEYLPDPGLNAHFSCIGTWILYNWATWEAPLLSSRSVMSNCLWPHRLQDARLPCPSLTPRVCSDSCPLSWWYHPAISSSVIPFSFFPSIRVFSNVDSLHQVATVVELQNQSFQWIFRIDFH